MRSPNKLRQSGFGGVKPIKNMEAHEWCLHKHYAKRIPSISYAFGLFNAGELVGIVTYGMPASPNLCVGVCGGGYRDNVLELNRLCINDDVKKGHASFLIGRSLALIPKPKIIVSYADTAMNHIGYVYQATNFIYTGATKERTDIAGEDGSHSRHHSGDKSNRVFRSSKHRYIYFCGTKKQKKAMEEALNYPRLPYPKGEIKKYDASYQPSTQKHLF